MLMRKVITKNASLISAQTDVQAGTPSDKVT